ncbi:hypothetical protein [Streptomyces sp. RPT161]|uniref:hypothetical protein n=1 Tax=Streptomyces sp. RPT161 TaxID=3015993 RepID=UPI0022B8677C|nr:hypothetical protein [Streptomyces sp. RPT161]
MPIEMEKPRDPAELYRALGEDVNPARPILTGDVFENVAVIDTDGSSTVETVMVLDHPCSLRGEDGVNLAARLVVAQVRRTQPGSWRTGHYNRMFLPAPFPGADGKANPCAAFFDSCFQVSPSQLEAGTRIACLTPAGINLMLQRRVKHFSRVTVETHKFNEANLGVYEEADLIEDWCLEREDRDVKSEEAFAECIAWLREDLGGRTRQGLLKDSQQRSTVRKQMTDYLRQLRAESRN